MRLVTWNCCRGPARRKRALLDALHPDLCVVQECPKPTATDGSFLWFGNNPRNGIAVVASGDYSIAPVPQRDVPPFTVPIQVTGPISFLLLAVWSQRNHDFRYVRAVIRAVECYQDLIVSQPTVVAGDFNSNTIWDYKRPAGQNHSGLVRQLASLGLVSAYHHFFCEAHGAESQPTLYLQRNPLKPYHIDYCFIPEAWRIHLSRVEIGSGDTWAAQSDHRPLVIDVDLPGDSRVSMPNNTLQRSGMNVRCEPRGGWPADERER
jgi:hypothetical protein